MVFAGSIVAFLRSATEKNAHRILWAQDTPRVWVKVVISTVWWSLRYVNLFFCIPKLKLRLVLGLKWLILRNMRYKHFTIHYIKLYIWLYTMIFFLHYICAYSWWANDVFCSRCMVVGTRRSQLEEAKSVKWSPRSLSTTEKLPPTPRDDIKRCGNVWGRWCIFLLFGRQPKLDVLKFLGLSKPRSPT